MMAVCQYDHLMTQLRIELPAIMVISKRCDLNVISGAQARVAASAKVLPSAAADRASPEG